MAGLRRCFNEPRSDCRKVEEPQIQGLPFSEQHESQTSKRGGITRGQTVLGSQRSEYGKILSIQRRLKLMLRRY